MAVTFELTMLFPLVTAWGPRGRNHPFDSHECGIENSDQPQSMQTRISGDGVSGGWLSVRGPFTIKPYLRRDDREGAGLAFRANHLNTPQTKLHF